MTNLRVAASGMANLWEELTTLWEELTTHHTGEPMAKCAKKKGASILRHL
jgi:hypothetical protein